MKVICHCASFSASDVVGTPSSTFFVSSLALLLQLDTQVASVLVFLCLQVLTLTCFSSTVCYQLHLGPDSWVLPLRLCPAVPCLGLSIRLHWVSLTLDLETSLTRLLGDDKVLLLLVLSLAVSVQTHVGGELQRSKCFSLR